MKALFGVSGRIAAALVVLAWLTYLAGDTALPMPALYLIVMLYGTLRLERTRLAMLATFALVTHGTALFLLIEHGAKLTLPAAGLQLATLFAALACFVLGAGTVLRLRERVAEAHGKFHDLALEANERASRDALTGVYHHRHLMDSLEREIARAERVGKPLSIARVDLDWLGSVNESHGHAAGDIALKRFAAAALSALRDVDVFGRYGGKEFLVVMPDTDLKGAIIAAERVHAAVGREPLPEARERRHLSCTLGVAEHRQGENTRLAIGRAEAGLSFAKAAGRDRVIALGPGDRPLDIGAA